MQVSSSDRHEECSQYHGLMEESNAVLGCSKERPGGQRASAREGKEGELGWKKE